MDKGRGICERFFLIFSAFGFQICSYFPLFPFSPFFSFSPPLPSLLPLLFSAGYVITRGEGQVCRGGWRQRGGEGQLTDRAVFLLDCNQAYSLLYFSPPPFTIYFTPLPSLPSFYFFLKLTSYISFFCTLNCFFPPPPHFLLLNPFLLHSLFWTPYYSFLAPNPLQSLIFEPPPPHSLISLIF